jgi:putative ABC transport system substrate-binding protein
VNRREALAAIAAGLLVKPLLGIAKNSDRVPVVGFLITHPPIDVPVVDSLRNGLRRYGYIDGNNIRLEVRSALGQLDRVAQMAEEMVNIPADVIVIVNEIALKAVKGATSTIPIVMVGFTDDPVVEGWIDSYRRPGTNVTGIFNVNANLVAKRLEVLKEALPKLSRVAVFRDPVFGYRQLDELKAAAKLLAVELAVIEVRDGDGLPGAFKTAKRTRAGAVMFLWSPVFYLQRRQAAQLGLAHRMPTMGSQDVLAYEGCMMFYGSQTGPAFERAGYFVDRLIKGTKPDELPVEQLSELKLIVNLKTAEKLGVSLPRSILLRADEVIE